MKSSRRVGECITRKIQHKTPLKVMVINMSGKLAYHDCVVIFENAKELSF